MIGLLLAAALAQTPTRASAEACGNATTETSRRYVGFASGAASELDAVEQALAQARDRALADLCAGDLADAGVCEALGQYVFDGKGFPKAKRSASGAWGTCAWVDVRQEGFAAIRAQREQVQADGIRAARAIRDALAPGAAPVAVTPGEGLYLEAPTWAGGCDAGLTGASVHALLRDAVLGASGQVLQSRRGDAAHAVEVTLTLVGTGELAVKPRLVGATGARELPGFSIPKGFFPTDRKAADRCRSWTALGLGARARAGRTGLTVDVSMDAPDHDVCAGEAFRVDVVARGVAPGAPPPELVLLSVAPDGSAFVSLRRPGPELSTTSGSFPSAPEAQEAFVALAVPAGTSFEPGWVRDCLLPKGGFHADRLPPEVAWTQVTYTTRDTGTGRCTSTDPKIAQTKERIRQILAAAPACGTGR